MMNGKRFALVISMLSMLLAGAASADQIYTDSAAFEARLVTPIEIDFEVNIKELGPIVGDPWLDLGIVFDRIGSGNNMALHLESGFFHIYAQGGEAYGIEISFPVSPPTAFGLDVFSNNTHDPSERIIFYGFDRNVLADIEMPGTGTLDTAFVGYIADESIVRVEFQDAADLDYVGISRVIFAATTTATEGTTFGSIKSLYR